MCVVNDNKMHNYVVPDILTKMICDGRVVVCTISELHQYNYSHDLIRTNAV